MVCLSSTPRMLGNARERLERLHQTNCINSSLGVDAVSSLSYARLIGDMRRQRSSTCLRLRRKRERPKEPQRVEKRSP